MYDTLPTETEAVTIASKHVVNAEELWNEVFGSNFESLQPEWLFEMDFDPKIMSVRLVVGDPDDGGEIVKTITPRHLAEAVGDVLSEGYCDPCTGKTITLFAPHGDSDWDACIGEIVLQTAVYGEIIYG